MKSSHASDVLEINSNKGCFQMQAALQAAVKGNLEIGLIKRNQFVQSHFDRLRLVVQIVM